MNVFTVHCCCACAPPAVQLHARLLESHACTFDRTLALKKTRLRQLPELLCRGPAIAPLHSQTAPVLSQKVCMSCCADAQLGKISTQYQPLRDISVKNTVVEVKIMQQMS